MSNEVTTLSAGGEIMHREPMTLNAAAVTQTMDMLKQVRQFVAKEMVDGTDFGVIPGTGTQKVMLLSGAMKVCMLYNCYPKYSVETSEIGGGHVEFRVKTELVSRATDAVVGSGLGSCSTMESKYRWRNSDAFEVTDMAIPADAKEKKADYRKKGFGMKKTDAGWVWVRFTGGGTRAENEDIYDQRNTVLKMAKKRSLVDASIGLGCMADLFTQDLDDDVGHGEPKQERRETAKNGPAPLDGKDILARIQAADKSFAAEGWCPAGAVIAFVQGDRKDPIDTWSQAELQAVVFAVKARGKELKVAKAKRDAERSDPTNGSSTTPKDTTSTPASAPTTSSPISQATDPNTPPWSDLSPHDQAIADWKGLLESKPDAERLNASLADAYDNLPKETKGVVWKLIESYADGAGFAYDQEIESFVKKDPVRGPR